MRCVLESFSLIRNMGSVFAKRYLVEGQIKRVCNNCNYYGYTGLLCVFPLAKIAILLKKNKRANK